MTWPVDSFWLEWRFPGDRPWAERVRSGRRRAQWIGGAAGFAGGVGFAFGADVLQGGSGSPDAQAWQLWAAVVAGISGFAVFIVGLSWMNRTGARQAAATSPLWALRLEQRRSVARQIRAARPEYPGDIPFLRDVAARIAAQSAVACLYAGLILLWVALTVPDPNPVRLLLLLAYVGLAAYTWRRVVTARAFLDRTSAAPVLGAQPTLRMPGS